MSVLGRLLSTRRHGAFGTDPGDYDERTVARALKVLDYLFGPRGPFPASFEGFENVPEAPALIVSNHSGGSTTLDAWGFGYGWYGHFGRGRVLHILAHEFLMTARWSAGLLSRMGGLRAAPGRAREVLDDWGRDLLVMPGGDRDTWRPWKDRHRVQFGGHRGYARLALRTGVPAVPVAHVGAHNTLVVLTDGASLARRLRLHEIARIDVFPIHLSLPWGLGFGPLPHVPLPARMRYRIGAPVELPAGWRPGAEVTEDHVRAYDARVQAALGSLLDSLAREEPAPVRASKRDTGTTPSRDRSHGFYPKHLATSAGVGGLLGLVGLPRGRVLLALLHGAEQASHDGEQLEDRLWGSARPRGQRWLDEV